MTLIAFAANEIAIGGLTLKARNATYNNHNRQYSVMLKDTAMVYANEHTEAFVMLQTSVATDGNAVACRCEQSWYACLWHQVLLAISNSG
jgi:hypothetical protein